MCQNQHKVTLFVRKKKHKGIFKKYVFLSIKQQILERRMVVVAMTKSLNNNTVSG